MPTIDLKAPNHNLSNSLLTPIAAMNLEAIGNHVGSYQFVEGTNQQALIVNWEPYEQNFNDKIKELQFHERIHQPIQVWVAVDFKNYRKAYFDVFHDIEKHNNLVVDHIFNRKLARIWNYEYIRLIHVDRSINSSSGKGQETFGVDLMKDNEEYRVKVKERNIAYADPFDLLKIVNLKVGKKPFINVSDSFTFWY